ncbi:MAG: phosphatase PAP2 family protein, partial [Chloroflexota bacterium]
PGSGYAYSRRVGQLGSGFTDFGIAGTFYLLGRARSNERARATGLLGFQALADTLIVIHTLKTVMQRPRPTHADGRTRIHNADGQFFSGGRSFPSGHAGNAWALATVVAHQYRHRRWVPPTAYSLAGLVAVSRVGQRRHFPADVLVGSALGYLIGRHVSRTYARPPEPAETARRAVPQMTLEVPVGGGTAFLLRWEF